MGRSHYTTQTPGRYAARSSAARSSRGVLASARSSARLRGGRQPELVRGQPAHPAEGADMTLNRRQVLGGGLGLGAAAGLSSCAGLTGRSSSDTPTATGSGGALEAELTFVNWSGDAEKKAFDARHPGLPDGEPGHHRQDRDGPLRQHPDQPGLPVPGGQPAGPVPGLLHRHRPVHEPGRPARRLRRPSTRPRSTPSCRACGRASSTTASRTGSPTRSTPPRSSTASTRSRPPASPTSRPGWTTPGPGRSSPRPAASSRPPSRASRAPSSTTGRAPAPTAGSPGCSRRVATPWLKTSAPP